MWGARQWYGPHDFHSVILVVSTIGTRGIIDMPLG
jgi:hypothetical protein